MKKLTKAQASQKKELVERIDRLVSELNSAIMEANDFRQEVNDAQEEYYDERSENWQDGDTGQAYSEWRDSWSEEFEEIECTVSEDLDAMTDEFEV